MAHHDSHATTVFHMISLYFVLFVSTSGTVLLVPEPHPDGMYHICTVSFQMIVKAVCNWYGLGHRVDIVTITFLPA